MGSGSGRDQDHAHSRPPSRPAHLPAPAAFPPYLPTRLQVHSARCRSSRSPSSRRTKRRTSAARWRRSRGRTRSSSSIRTAPTRRSSIARRHTDRVVVREWPGYVEQKNHAASIASHDWILSLDADERVTPALADEIKALLAGAPRDGRRFAFRASRGISDDGSASTDWYPDYQLRLYDRRSAQWTGTLRARGA